jgi:DNA processing protein
MYKVNKLTFSHPKYPEQLKHIPTPPKELYVAGNLSALETPYSLSVIGSRKPTSYGLSVVDALVEPVAARQITIVSGLALGIDAAAHKTALRTQGKAIAVLAGGLDEIHPRRHHQLAKEIIRLGGALISEYPPGTPPTRGQFVARNRIVSGLSQATLIIEAAIKSGTLHTANFALEQGRGVLAVPGSILSPQSEGTNRLIRQGARPTLEASDIFDELGLVEEPASEKTYRAASEQEAILLKLLAEAGIIEGQELLEKSELDTQSYNQTMTMLELSGKIRSLGADNWSLH